MKKQLQREGSNDAKLADVISLADYRANHKPPENEPEICFSIKDGDLVSTAAHVKPEHVHLLVRAMAKMSVELTEFLNAAKTAMLCTALVGAYFYADSSIWPARAASTPTHPHAKQDLKEGRGENMHKWLAQRAHMD